MSITPNTIIAQVNFQNVLNSVTSILNTSSLGYGVEATADYVSTGTSIFQPPWAELYNDVNRIYTHQQGVELSYPEGTFPQSGRPVFRSFVNTLIDALDTATSNIYTVHPSQLTSVTTGSSTVGTSTFTNILTNTVVLEWSEEREVDWYFNLGGYLATDLSPTPVTTTDPDHIRIINLINDFRTTITEPFDRAAWLTTKTLPNRTFTVSSSTATTFGTFTGYFTVSNTYQILDGDYATTSTIKITTEIMPPGIEELVPEFKLLATVTVTDYASTGSIIASRAELTQTRDFDDVIVSPSVRRTRTVTANTASLLYSLVGGSSSTAQTFVITNNNVNPSSAVATITEIQVTSNVVTPYISYDSLPITLGVGDSTTVSLYWDNPTVTARDLGEHPNSIIVKSNNTFGDIKVPVRVFVSEPPGTWNFSPTGASENLLTYKKISKSISIVPEYATIRRIISINLSQVGSNNFTIAKRPTVNDPLIVIDYEPNVTTTGIYTGTLTATVEIVDITGDITQETRNFIFTVDQTLGDQNLGNWISPIGAVNSVIGASYDIVDGKRYLTLGVGVGADGSPNIDNGGGTDRYANPAYLGINNNSLVASNYPFSRYQESETLGFSQLLKDYGVKANPVYIGPNDVACEFDIEIPETGDYTVRYSVFETGYVAIDGEIYINRSGLNSDNYKLETSRLINLTAGTHTIRFVGNLRMALTVSKTSNNSLIWSTLNLLQTGPAYRYWWEVYRFPIDDTSGQLTRMRSKDYRVKNTAAVISTPENKRFPYGDFFGYDVKDIGSIFEVRSDGRGGVTIFVLPPIQEGKIDDTVTVGSLYFAFYYKQFSIPRYTHKTGGQYDNDSEYTDLFIGFDRFGGIRTQRARIPRDFDYSSGTRNGTIDKLITFFASSLITDYVIIESGLFISWYAIETISAGSVLLTQNISFGAYLLTQLGVDIGASQTVGGYIINYFSSFFTASAAPQATTVLAGYAPTVQALGGANAVSTALAEKVLVGVGEDLAATELGAFILEAKTAGITELVPLLQPGYIAPDAATAVVAAETGSLAGATVGSILSTAAGLVLTAVGIKYIADGIREGDIGSVAVGSIATYIGYTLAETFFTAVIAAITCFTGDTPIELADGTIKPIKDIKIGDLVFNHDRTQVNKVLMIQKSDSSGFGNVLWSPSKDIEPFATLNHPIYIDGVLSAADPKVALEWQPWLDNVKKAQNAVVKRTFNQKVYNIYPDGDATFRVYNYGAPSLASGDEVLFRMYEQGVISFDEVQDILNGIIEQAGEKYGPNLIYGGVILSDMMIKLNVNWLMKFGIRFWLVKNPFLRSIISRFITLVGTAGMLVNKKNKRLENK